MQNRSNFRLALVIEVAMVVAVAVVALVQFGCAPQTTRVDRFVAIL